MRTHPHELNRVSTLSTGSFKSPREMNFFPTLPFISRGVDPRPRAKTRKGLLFNPTVRPNPETAEQGGSARTASTGQDCWRALWSPMRVWLHPGGA